MSTKAWTDVLDELERRVESGESSLDNGTPIEPFILEPFVPPEGLGPLPEMLYDRAIELLQMHADVERRFETAMETIQRSIVKSKGASQRTHSAFAEVSIPKYFDKAV